MGISCRADSSADAVECARDGYRVGRGSGDCGSAVNGGGAAGRTGGVARGDAAFDFAYYDAAAASIAAGHRQSFEASIAQARGKLSGWRVIPPVPMVAVMLLAPIGVRPRLAEYR